MITFMTNAHTDYADQLGGSNGDGAQRGTVTIPDLAPYENHPAQQLDLIVDLSVNLYGRPSINSRTVQIPV